MERLLFKVKGVFIVVPRDIHHTSTFVKGVINHHYSFMSLYLYTTKGNANTATLEIDRELTIL